MITKVYIKKTTKKKKIVLETFVDNLRPEGEMLIGNLQSFLHPLKSELRYTKGDKRLRNISQYHYLYLQAPKYR